MAIQATSADTSPGDPAFLSEMQESEAPADIRAIYAEIRQLTGVPMTALIWRHLATLPGVLPDVWSSLAPVMRSGVLQVTAWRIAANARVPVLEALPPAALASMGLSEPDQGALACVLEAYNRANPVNMLCVHALLARLLRPDGQALAPDVVLWTPPQSTGPLPRMFAPAEMEPVLRRRLESVSGPDARDGMPVIPSLYRHLVPWPGLIAWVAVAIPTTSCRRAKSLICFTSVVACTAAIGEPRYRLPVRHPPGAR